MVSKIPSPIMVPPSFGYGQNTTPVAPKIPDPILVVPPSRQHPVRPIMVVPHSKQTGPVDITAKATRASLMRRVEAFLKTNPKGSATGPINPDQFTSTNVTPLNEFGVERTAYNVNGELWVKQQAVYPGAKATWFDLGRLAA